MEKIICPNCDGEQVLAFCPSCGQKRVEGRLKWIDVKSDLLANVIHVEKRFFRTILEIFKNPKGLIEKYSRGIRKKYAVPVQFFLFSLTVYLLLYNIFEREVIENLKMSVDGDTAEEIDRGISQTQQIRDSISKYMSYLYFCLPPIIAFYISRFFRKSVNYAEALVLAFYIEAINLFIAVLFLFLPVGIVGQSLKSVFSLALFVYVFTRISDKWYWGAIKGVLVYLFGIITFSSIIAGMLFLMLYQKGLV